MKYKSLLYTIFWFAAALWLWSCESDTKEEEIPKGTLQFVLKPHFVPESLADARGEASSREGEPDPYFYYVDYPKGVTQARITLNNFTVKTEVTYNSELRQFFAKPLLLGPGDFTLRTFELLNDEGKTLYLCPTQDASEEILELVETPLPIDFSMSGPSHSLAVEVIPVIDWDAKAYGYTFFTIDFKELLGLGMSVLHEDYSEGFDGTFDMEIIRMRDNKLLHRADSLAFGYHRITADIEGTGGADILLINLQAEGLPPQAHVFEMWQYNMYQRGPLFGEPRLFVELGQEQKRVYHHWYGEKFINSREEAEAFAMYEFTHITTPLVFKQMNESLDFAIFNSIREIEGGLEIRNSPGLQEISGFQNLRRLRSLGIGGCESLTKISGFDSLQAVAWYFSLGDCPSLEDPCPFPERFRSFAEAPEYFSVKNLKDSVSYTYEEFLELECD
ncbi:MAG: hypothetical protein MI784_07230 [Cytophagales bacterium]|nr:hypothetical protein [Cytophagales bacterium]